MNLTATGLLRHLSLLFVAAVRCSIGIATFLGASPTTLFSIVPKSSTAPIAMGIAERIGGLPSLRAVLVVATGSYE